MPTYTAYITYTMSDDITIEADNDDDAYTIADNLINNNPTFLPLHSEMNVTYSWDGYEISLDTDPDPVVD